MVSGQVAASGEVMDRGAIEQAVWDLDMATSWDLAEGQRVRGCGHARIGSVHAEQIGSVPAEQVGGAHAEQLRLRRRVQFSHVPRCVRSLTADRQELVGEVGEGAGRLGKRKDWSPVVADSQLAGGVIQGDESEVTRAAKQVSTPVIEDEQEPSWQVSEPRIGAKIRIQRSSNATQISAAAGETGERRHHHVADELMRASREQAGGLDRRESRWVEFAGGARQTPHLQIGAGGQVDVSITESLGNIDERDQLASSDMTTDEPQPHEESVFSRPGPQRAGALVAAISNVGH